jgi:hypothetical protein
MLYRYAECHYADCHVLFLLYKNNIQQFTQKKLKNNIFKIAYI